MYFVQFLSIILTLQFSMTYNPYVSLLNQIANFSDLVPMTEFCIEVSIMLVHWC